MSAPWWACWRSRGVARGVVRGQVAVLIAGLDGRLAGTPGTPDSFVAVLAWYLLACTLAAGAVVCTIGFGAGWNT